MTNISVYVCLSIISLIFFIHSSISKASRLFPCLGYCNNAAIKWGRCGGVADIFFKIVISFLLDQNPEMKLLDHMVVLIFFVTSILVGGSDRKVSAYNVGDPASIPGWGRSPGEGNGNPLHYSCQENPTDRGAS